MPKGHRKYSETQKVEIIERLRSEQLSFHEASRVYDIPRSTLQDEESTIPTSASKFKQVTDMLESAFQKLPDKVDDLILHSDQGWQYQLRTYQQMLKAKGITQNMSRKATCLDSAVAENFFGLLRRNCSIWRNLILLTNSKRPLLSTSIITTTVESN